MFATYALASHLSPVQLVAVVGTAAYVDHPVPIGIRGLFAANVQQR
jgi:hypothetical protein